MGQLVGTALTVVGYAVGAYFNVPQLGALVGCCCGDPLPVGEPDSDAQQPQAPAVDAEQPTP